MKRAGPAPRAWQDSRRAHVQPRADPSDGPVDVSAAKRQRLHLRTAKAISRVTPTSNRTLEISPTTCRAPGAPVTAQAWCAT